MPILVKSDDGRSERKAKVRHGRLQVARSQWVKLSTGEFNRGSNPMMNYLWHPIHGGSRNTLKWFMLCTETGTSSNSIGDLNCKHGWICRLFPNRHTISSANFKVGGWDHEVISWQWATVENPFLFMQGFCLPVLPLVADSNQHTWETWSVPETKNNRNSHIIV